MRNTETRLIWNAGDETARVENEVRAGLANRRAERTGWIEWKN